jgi:hypothetical protein
VIDRLREINGRRGRHCGRKLEVLNRWLKLAKEEADAEEAT